LFWWPAAAVVAVSCRTKQQAKPALNTTATTAFTATHKLQQHIEGNTEFNTHRLLLGYIFAVVICIATVASPKQRLLIA
jgi:hypothetical protein